MGKWKNRIVEFGVKAADQFTPHPENLKIHPEWQRAALGGFLEEIGWTGVVAESKRSGYLLDGHERIWQALQTNEEVPYIVLDLSEEEEEKMLLKFDYIGGMARYDHQRTAAMLQRVQTSNAALQKMMADMGARLKLPPPPLTNPGLPSRTGDTEHPEGAHSTGSIPAAPPLTADDLPLSAIRQVQLFLQPAEYDQIMTWVQALKAHYAVDNITDTVYKAVEYAYHHRS